jgi:hypothetical protein
MGTKWGVWAYYIQCDKKKEDEEFIEPEKEYLAEEWDGTIQKTKSRRRRQQRRAAKRYLEGDGDGGNGTSPSGCQQEVHRGIPVRTHRQ